MNALHSFLFAAAVLAALVGALFAAGTAYYLTGYLTAASELAARDHLAGVAVGLRYTFAAFAVTAALTFPIRHALPGPLARLLILPAAVTAVLLLMSLAWRAAAGQLH